MPYKDFDITKAEVQKLLNEELAMRAKQPEAWTKTKYRAGAKWREHINEKRAKVN